MHCNYIPDHILKDLGDKKSLLISKKLRSLRNRFNRLLTKLTAIDFPVKKRRGL